MIGSKWAAVLTLSVLGEVSGVNLNLYFMPCLVPKEMGEHNDNDNNIVYCIILCYR